MTAVRVLPLVLALSLPVTGCSKKTPGSSPESSPPAPAPSEGAEPGPTNPEQPPPAAASSEHPEAGAASAEEAAMAFVKAAGARDLAGVQALCPAATVCDGLPAEQQGGCQAYVSTVAEGLPQVMGQVPEGAVPVSATCESMGPNVSKCQVSVEGEGGPAGCMFGQAPDERFYLLVGVPRGP